MQALIIGHYQESRDLIKAVCLYKNCKVIVIDNLLDLNFLNSEKIDIVFMEFDSLQSLATDLVFSLVNANAAGQPVIIVSENIGLAEDIELQKRSIFYRLAKPINTEEIKNVIDAAISTVGKIEGHEDEVCMAAAAPAIESHQQSEPKAFGGAVSYVLMLLGNVDKQAGSIARSATSKHLDDAVSLLNVPINHFDNFMKRTATNLFL
jgi:DNA-binding NtrC family response regulator